MQTHVHLSSGSSATYVADECVRALALKANSYEQIWFFFPKHVLDEQIVQLANIINDMLAQPVSLLEAANDR